MKKVKQDVGAGAEQAPVAVNGVFRPPRPNVVLPKGYTIVGGRLVRASEVVEAKEAFLATLSR